MPEKLARTVGLMSITRSAVVCWIVVLAAPAPAMTVPLAQDVQVAGGVMSFVGAGDGQQEGARTQVDRKRLACRKGCSRRSWR